MELTQKKWFFNSQSFKILQNDIIVTIKKGLSTTEYQVPLCHLDANSIVSKNIDTRLLIPAIVFFLMCLFCLMNIFGITKFGDTGTWVVLGIPCLFIFFLSAYNMKKQSYNLLIFNNIFTGHPAVALWRNKPNNAKFNAFADYLSGQISKLSIGDSNLQIQAGMANEIRKLHGLFEEGILSEDEYEAGKAKVLSMEGDEWKY